MRDFLLSSLSAADLIPEPPMIKIPDVTSFPEIKSQPEYAYDALVEEIKAFEKTLRETEAVGTLLASFGQSILLSIHNVKLSGQFICMEGLTSDGEEATLVQHYTQTSMLLRKVKTEGPRRPIGFTAG